MDFNELMQVLTNSGTLIRTWWRCHADEHSLLIADLGWLTVRLDRSVIWLAVVALCLALGQVVIVDLQRIKGWLFSVWWWTRVDTDGLQRLVDTGRGRRVCLLIEIFLFERVVQLCSPLMLDGFLTICLRELVVFRLQGVLVDRHI